tara:strand:+ start:156 stop:497 length:342 start_codon:yes stop_codon:yes gene_type:complete
MKITKSQLRQIIREEIRHHQIGVSDRYDDLVKLAHQLGGHITGKSWRGESFPGGTDEEALKNNVLHMLMRNSEIQNLVRSYLEDNGLTELSGVDRIDLAQLTAKNIVSRRQRD